MKTKLFTIALFTLFNFAIAYAQNTENNCPPHYTRSAIKIPKVDIAKIEVVDSAKYFALPNLITKIDSLTPNFTNLDMEIEGTVSFFLDINQSGKVEAAKLTGQTGYSVYNNFARDFIKDAKFEPQKLIMKKLTLKLKFGLIFY